MNQIIKILTFLLLFLYSCTQPEQKFDKSELIPEKDLGPLLYDLHLADGLLSLSEVRNEFIDIDSLEHYFTILEKHGYTFDQLNNTIEYYSGDPETLNEIHEKVISQLTELEGEILATASEKKPSAPNLWEGKTSWNLPADGKQNKLEFEVPVKAPGTYKIIVDITLYEDDEALEPAITAYFWFDDQTETGYRLPFPKTRIVRTGVQRTYRVAQKVMNPKITHLKGSLLNHTQQRGEWQKHVLVSNFKIEFEPLIGPVK